MPGLSLHTDPYAATAVAVAAAAAGGTGSGEETTTTADTTTTAAAAATVITTSPEKDDGLKEEVNREVDLRVIDHPPWHPYSPPPPDTSFDVEPMSWETLVVSEMREIQRFYEQLIKGQRRSLSEVEKTRTESSVGNIAAHLSSLDIINFLKNLADTIVCLENVLGKKKIVTTSGRWTFRYTIQPANEEIQMRMKNIDHEIKQLQHQLLQNSPSNSITPAAKLEKSGTVKRKADDEDEVAAAKGTFLKLRRKSSLEKSPSSDRIISSSPITSDPASLTWSVDTDPLLSPPPLQIDIPPVSPPPPPAPPTQLPLSPPPPLPEGSLELEDLFQLLYPQVNVIQQQDGLSSPTFACADCGKVFAKKSLLAKHHRAEHEGVRYPCNKCNYQAKQMRYLKCHMEGKHSDNRLRCSDYCNFQTKWRKSLRRHRKNCMSRLAGERRVSSSSLLRLGGQLSPERRLASTVNKIENWCLNTSNVK